VLSTWVVGPQLHFEVLYAAMDCGSSLCFCRSLGRTGPGPKCNAFLPYVNGLRELCPWVLSGPRTDRKGGVTLGREFIMGHLCRGYLPKDTVLNELKMCAAVHCCPTRVSNPLSSGRLRARCDVATDAFFAPRACCRWRGCLQRARFWWSVRHTF